jgi:two-component system nitrogen regulation response regulator GlnG/two-component system response regulator AtoC
MVQRAVLEADHRLVGELEAAIGRWLDAQLSLTPEASWNHDDLMDGIEAVALKHLLGRFEMRPTRMAAALRMNRATLRQKLRRLGIERGKEL